MVEFMSGNVQNAFFLSFLLSTSELLLHKSHRAPSMNIVQFVSLTHYDQSLNLVSSITAQHVSYWLPVKAFLQQDKCNVICCFSPAAIRALHLPSPPTGGAHSVAISSQIKWHSFITYIYIYRYIYLYIYIYMQTHTLRLPMFLAHFYIKIKYGVG